MDTLPRTRLIKLEGDAAKEAATSGVDAAIKARKFAPAQRDSLVKMAIGSPTEFAELIKATADGAILPSGERGQDGAETYGELEPTQTELSVAKQAGVTREEIIATKARTRGIAVPEPVAKVLAARASAK